MKCKSEYQANLDMARLRASREEVVRYAIGRPIFHRPSAPSVARRAIETMVRRIAGF